MKKLLLVALVLLSSCAHRRVITVNSKNIGDKIINSEQTCISPCKIKVTYKDPTVCDSTITILSVDKNSGMVRYVQLLDVQIQQLK